MRNGKFKQETKNEDEVSGMRKITGFTLLEVIIGLFILQLILCLGIAAYGTHAGTTREKVQQANIERIEGAVQLYRLDTGAYPSSVQELVDKPEGVSGWRGPYLDEWPVDPWDAARAYQINGMGQVR